MNAPTARIDKKDYSSPGSLDYIYIGLISGYSSTHRNNTITTFLESI